MVNVITTTPDFDALLSSTKYVVVDFMADWCPPCKAIAPLYEKLSGQHAVPGQLAFAKVNVDTVPEVAGRFGISAIPSFLFFEDGKPAAVDVAAAGKTAGPGATVAAGKVERIRSADPKSLTAVAETWGALAKAASAAAPKREEAAAPAADAPKDDGSTVSGGYTLGAEGGKRADWKQSLN